jgi:hypothetical protein
MQTKLKTLAILVIALLAPGAAVAGQRPDDDAKGTVVVRAEARLGSYVLPAGKYGAKILTGDEHVLVLTQDGKEVARAAVDRHETTAPMPYDQIRIGASATGANEVVAVTFKGRRDTFTVRSAEQLANSSKP